MAVALLASLVASAVVGIVSASATPECTDIYKGPESGAWSSAENWSAGVPTASSVACWGSGTEVRVLEGAETADSIQGGRLAVIGGSLTLTSASDQSTLAGRLEITAGTVDLGGALAIATTGTSKGLGEFVESGGALNGPGSLALAGFIHWFGGSISASRETVITQTEDRFEGAPLLIGGEGTPLLGGGSISTTEPVSITNAKFTGEDLTGVSTLTTASTVSFAPGTYKGGSALTIEAKGFLTEAGETKPGVDLLLTGDESKLGGSLAVPQLATDGGTKLEVPKGIDLSSEGGTIGGAIVGEGNYIQAGGATGLAEGATLSTDTVELPGGTLAIYGGTTYDVLSATKVSGGTLDVAGSIAKAGKLEQATGTTLVGETGTLVAESPIIKGGFLVDNGTLEAPTTTLEKGLVMGTGTVKGSLLNDFGVVAPGGAEAYAPGKLTVDGEYFQGAEGELYVAVGGTASGEFSVLSVNGEIEIGGRLGMYPTPGYAESAKPGDRIEFLPHSGTRTNEFAQVLERPPLTGGKSFKAEYSEPAAVDAAVVGDGTPTTTTLSASPPAAVTNQVVTLTATVSSDVAGPSGTVSFANHGVPVPGCEGRPLEFNGSADVATCQSAFTAGSSPEALTATFIPSVGSGFEGSMSATDNLAVGKDATTTLLAVSSTTPPAGASVTYTATVTPNHAGATEPSGSVEFLDGAVPIGQCSEQLLAQSASSSTATCSLSYPVPGAHSITATYLGDGNFASSSATSREVDVQPGTSPLTSTSPPTVLGSSGAAFAGSVNPEGLVTSAHFEYGLDKHYSEAGGSGPSYEASTPTQAVGSDFSAHALSASAAGLIPNALYHVRLVATNGAGTTFGSDQTFTTKQDPPPPPPELGHTFNVEPVSGVVFIKPPAGKALASAALSKGVGFVPLTEARQIPAGSQIDALSGSLKLLTASGHIGKLQSGVFGGAVFKATQSRSRLQKGLSTLSLLDGAFPGVPSYSSCHAHPAGKATEARAKSSVLQRLHASAHGNFTTRGRYSAATVRGTEWDTIDRCDGTLTKVERDSVLVRDFVRRKTILVHAGHSYLASASGRIRKGR
jgi:hypothetical protein